MRAFFKDNDKIIINSMDYTEALVGKQFLENVTGKTVKAEQRNDINDDFDGLVLTVGGPAPTEEEIQERIDAAVKEAEAARIKEVTVDLNKETLAVGDNVISDTENLKAISTLLECPDNYDTPVLKLLIGEDTVETVLSTYGFELINDQKATFLTFKAHTDTNEYVCSFANDATQTIEVTEISS